MVEPKGRSSHPERQGATRRTRTAAPPSSSEKRGSRDRRLPGIDPQRLTDLGLSRRELAVLELVARGQTNEQIGEALRVSPLTVKKHLERMCARLGVANRAALVAVAWSRSRGT